MADDSVEMARSCWSRRLRGVGAVLLFTATASASAAFLMTVDRETFQAATSSDGVTEEDFDALASGTILTVTPNVTYSASAGQPVVTNAYLTTTGANGLGRTGVGFFLSSDTATFTFTHMVSAFAIDINTYATNAAAYRATLNTGDVANSLFEVFPGQGTGQFIGFVSDTPFSSVTVAAAGTTEPYTLDTLVYGNARDVVNPGTSVPLPGTLWLLGAGLLAAGALSRRRDARNGASG